MSTKCIWFRIRGKFPPINDVTSILKLAYEALDEYGKLPKSDSERNAEEVLLRTFGNTKYLLKAGGGWELKDLRGMLKSNKKSQTLIVQDKEGIGKTNLAKMPAIEQQKQLETAKDLYRDKKKATKTKIKKSK